MSIYTRLILIISVIIECFIMVYYTNTSLTYKNSRAVSNAYTCIGYIIIGIISMLNIPYLNLVSFAVINYIILRTAFTETRNDALIRDVVITAFMMFGEIVFSLCIDQKIDTYFIFVPMFWEDIVFTFGSKLMYFISMIVFKNFTVNRTGIEHVKELFLLFLLPIISCGYFVAINVASASMETDLKFRLVIIGLLLIISNYIVYIVYDRMIEKNIKIREIQRMQAKKDIDYNGYEIMKSQYNDFRILAHDFNKYCNIIEGMLTKEQAEILNQTKHIKNLSGEFLLIECTNNKALNVLLSQKMKECHKKGINFQIYARAIDLSFINEVDCVSIFTNLIDNAIEACDKSEIKNIYLNICSINDSFIVVKLENNADKQPVNNNGILKTSKTDAHNHGIGYASVKRALCNYNADIRWSYSNRIFTTVILFNRFTDFVEN